MLPGYTDLGLAIIRVVVGGIVAAHGLQKFGFLGGRGLTQTASFFEGGLNFRPAAFWALVVAVTELVGGLLLVLGLLGPIAPLMVAADMLVALIVVHLPKGFWNTNGGIEFTLALGGTSFGLALTGFGGLSLDSVLRLAIPDWLLPLWLAITIVGVALALFSRAQLGGAAAE